MRRFLVYSAFVFSMIVLHSNAYAQCSTSIPGLPTGAGMPCADPFTPNTPSTPSDGPNAAGSPNAIKHDRDSCDADFMNQIHARSYLEANRELMFGQLLVRKPDSVLEYTCFDQAVRDTAEIAGPIFTESRYWLGSAGGTYGNISNPGSTFPTTIEINTFMGDTKLDTTLDQLVMASLNNFVNTNNFTHTFLGGASSVDDTVGSSVSAAGTTCTHMQDVWQLAKCENLDDSSFFMTFTEIAGADPRNTLPSGALSCSANPITTQLIDVANNDGGTYAFKDPATSYNNFIGDAGSCEAPIPTGLIVARRNTSYSSTGVVTSTPEPPFPDSVCPNPGCYFDNASNSCQN